MNRHYNKFDIETLIGRWPEIHIRMGIDSQYLKNKHGPCPGCGGTDRFRYDDKQGRGTFYCGGGGDPVSGDGFALLDHTYGWSFKESLERITGDSRPLPLPRPIKPVQSQQSATAGYARAVWERANRVDKYVAQHPYALRKGIPNAYGAGRTRASGRLIGQDVDCLVIPMRDINEGLCGVECINPDGVKQTFGKKGFLALGNTLDKSLPTYIVEGWADAVSAWMLLGNVIVYAAFSMSRISNLAEYLDAPGRTIITLRDNANDH